MTTDHPIQVGLVGCGAVSQLYYAPALKELERLGLLRVTALVDPSEASLSALRSQFSQASQAKDIAALTSDTLDLAIVASPPQYHAAQTIQLLKAGVSVLCEKPMASTVAEAEAMIEAAGQARGLLAIGLFRRFFPATQTIHSVLSLGLLGELESFECYEGGQFSWPVQSPDYFKRSLSGGGVLLDIGVHLLDLLIWWFGEPLEIHYEDDAMGGIDVNCALSCRFAQVSGTVRLSRDCDFTNRYIIRGSKGWLSWQVNEANSIQLGLANAPWALETTMHHQEFRAGLPLLKHSAFNFEQSFASQICNVVGAMRGDESLVVPGTEGIRSLRWIEHCYRYRQLMSMPWFSLLEATRAQQLSLACE
ncbi:MULTISPECIES: Gfo/Idh/MocA family oxidoreductase [Cyanophyceae]|uniref:Gfo/Idh/MocA family oxidoreductase n=1 Tax=Cyanophyceae TaxID=3028117 RepID=UPI0016877577|nr:MULTISPECIES: Gfo/Idh/MocA family oxidoreductase [Cyanophyceae]MBD1918181.1 Gfo/Idh/MocA family oxidoreductase [Phormidium sp. FACHB-77]MBD2030213.1 Gfo/Idh/MocA family oxidoreductase [Phormidium sp. FACHB-322]MBD2051415.1 Gfo/Idh/MocA family oxidoreductase [Leptolyngbya sp. FACHB-60]